MTNNEYNQFEKIVLGVGGAVMIGILVSLGISFDNNQSYSPSTQSAVVTTISEPTKEVEDISLTAMQEDNEIFTVETNFALNDSGLTLYVESVGYELAESNGTEYTFYNVHIPSLGENSARLVDSSGENYSFTITRTLNTVDEWNKYVDVIDYKVLSKDADRYAGENVRGTGRIMQILEESGMTWGMIQVTPLGWGYWDDNIYFIYDGLTDFVEDDIVNFYGIIEGDYTYESIAGWNITVPMVTVEIVE